MTTPAVVDKTRREVLTMMSPLLTRIKTLEVRDAATFAVADSLLARIRDARKQITARLAEVVDPAKEALDAAKKAYKATADFRDEMDAPLQDAEATIKAQMKDYKQLELRQRWEEESRRQEEVRKLELEAQEKERQELAAKTKGVRERLAKQREELLGKIVEAESAPAPAPVTAAHSGARVTKKWRVKDFDALVQATVDSSTNIPYDALMVNTVLVNKYFKEFPEEVAKWPGIEVYDDVVIVGR